MNVAELAELLDGQILTGDTGLDREVNGAYCCDLLSWVMSHADKGSAWVTVHTHLNIVAVALLSEISCIVVPEGIHVDEPTVKKASEEGIPVISCSINSYEVCGRTYQSIRTKPV